MLAKYGLYLKVEAPLEADHKTSFIPITEEIEETIISELGIWEEGKFKVIQVTHSQNKNDKASDAAVWDPKSFGNTTVGQFAVYSLMEAIENRITYKNNVPGPEGAEVLRQLENVEAKALPILEDLIGSERLSEVKKRIESVTFPSDEIRQIIIEELNLFLKERKSKRI